MVVYLQKHSLRAMFRDWDKDYSGSLDVDEFCSAMERHGFKASKDEVSCQHVCVLPARGRAHPVACRGPRLEVACRWAC